MPRPSRGGRSKGRRRGGPNRGRTVLGVVLVAVVALLLSLRAIATFWTDFLWFDSLDQSAVWRGQLSEKVTLGVATALVFFVLLCGNLFLADRLAPRFRSSAGPEEEILVRYRELIAGRQRLVWVVLSLLVAAIPGFSASARWREWILFRYGGSFGTDDPQFGHDLGFHMFQLPFLSAAVDWLFAFLLVTIVAVAIVHYLNGAIRLQPLGERVTPNAKAHLSILLALAAFVKAGDYYLQRYELLTSPGAGFDGAGFTDIHARLPAVQLMALISVAAGVAVLVNIRRSGWTLPLITVASWAIIAIIAGGVYPAIVQRFQVEPAELSKEEPYIQRNIDSTRRALGLDDVRQSDFDYDADLTREDLDASEVNLENARVVDPEIIRGTIQNLEFEREYYEFNDVDVDRYEVDGEIVPVVVSARELNLDGISAPNWEKLHMVYTHGYAAALAPANSVERGEPKFLVDGIPAKVSGGLPPLARPEIYHGEGMEGYAIVDTAQQELSSDDVTTEYEGRSGVGIGSLPRKAAFALRFGQIEPLFSENLTADSRVIYRRDVVDRVRTLAPFLTVDPDPFPALLDGRIKYIVDAYTLSSSHPYAQTVDARAVDRNVVGSFNYIRNSVKAVVDAYDGTVTMYLTDSLYGEEDPVIRAYVRAFPSLFTEEIPDEVRAHLRYPEFMFKAQTHMWGRYHQESARTFFNNSDRWAVGQRPSDEPAADDSNGSGRTGGTDTGSGSGTGTSSVQVSQQPRIDPYYQLLQIGDSDEAEFVLTRPFELASANDVGRSLPAIMIARNDPDSYGQLEQVVMVSGEGDDAGRNNNVDGPMQANRKMVTYQPFAQYVTDLIRSGSRVRIGNLMLLPFGDSLLYLRPTYAAEARSERFTLERIVVVSGEDVGFGQSIARALDDMLDEDPDGATGAVSEPIEEPEEPEETPPGEESEQRTATQLLAEADQKFEEAERSLAELDWEAYGRLVAEGRDLVSRAAELLGAETGGAAATPTTTTTTSIPAG